MKATANSARLANDAEGVELLKAKAPRAAMGHSKAIKYILDVSGPTKSIRQIINPSSSGARASGEVRLSGA
jgi:hypothetical protein